LDLIFKILDILLKDLRRKCRLCSTCRQFQLKISCRRPTQVFSTQPPGRKGPTFYAESFLQNCAAHTSSAATQKEVANVLEDRHTPHPPETDTGHSMSP